MVPAITLKMIRRWSKRASRQADGLVIACPVYWSDINGLTKTFLDKLRLSGFRG
jgi:NAD(P)H-dependent FMN reductase